jgi:hypothetical protein
MSIRNENHTGIIGLGGASIEFGDTERSHPDEITPLVLPTQAASSDEDDSDESEEVETVTPAPKRKRNSLGILTTPDLTASELKMKLWLQKDLGLEMMTQLPQTQLK